MLVSHGLDVTLLPVPALLSTCSSLFIRNLQVKRLSVVKTFYIEAFLKSIYCVTMYDHKLDFDID